MSDFDKEAEREKLRKKYEKDKQDREATQRMSDLLLKGATMTNSHCNTCGDPLFRQQGTTFCPSCHGGPEGVDASVPPADDETQTETDPATDSGPAHANSPQSVSDSADGPQEAISQQGQPPQPQQEQPQQPQQGQPPQPQQGQPQQGAPSRSQQGTGSTSSEPQRETAGTSNGFPAGDPVPGADIDDATNALVAALERFARAGAQADDPREAKECLEAAHEAAAALSTLRE